MHNIATSQIRFAFSVLFSHNVLKFLFVDLSIRKCIKDTAANSRDFCNIIVVVSNQQNCLHKPGIASRIGTSKT